MSNSRTAWIIYLSVASGFVAMYVPQAILPELAEVFGVSPARASLSISSLIVSLAFASLVIGPLSDAIGRKPVLVACAFMLSLPAFFAAASPNMNFLIAIRLIQGMFLPGVTAVSVAYIAEEFPVEQVKPVLGGYIAATVAGRLLSRVLSGSVTYLFGWRSAFVVSGLILVVIAFLLQRYLPASKYFESHDNGAAAFRGLLIHGRTPHMLGAFVAGFSLFFAFIAVFTYLPFYLEQPPFYFTPLAVGLIYFVYIAGVVSSPISGTLAQVFGSSRVMLIGLVIALFANIATVIPSAFTLVVALLVLCFGNFAAQSSATSFVATMAESHKGSATALYLFAYYIGGSLGAFVPGLAWQKLEWFGVLLFSTAALLIAMLAVRKLCLPVNEINKERVEDGDDPLEHHIYGDGA